MAQRTGARFSARRNSAGKLLGAVGLGLMVLFP